MTTHTCAECGLAHDTPEPRGEDPEVRAAKILADRDVEVAKIQAGVSRDEMLREIDTLRAELTVRQEEPPVAETTVVQETIEPGPEPEPEPEVIPVDTAPAEETPPPPEKEHEPAGESKSGGWWSGYR